MRLSSWRCATLGLFAVAILATGCPGRRADRDFEQASPFPLIPGARWTFEGHFEGQTFRDTLELRPVDVDGRACFAFYDIALPAEGQLLLGNMFADELFRRVGDTLYVADEHVRAEEHALLRFPLAEGATASYRVGTRTTSTHVEGEETVVVPAGTYTATRVRVRDDYDSGRVSESTVWLAAGVGVVKWQRATGRIDALVQFSVGGM